MLTIPEASKLAPIPPKADTDSMAGRTGSALLPLHGGRVPGWLVSDVVIVVMKVEDISRAKEYWHSDVLAQGRAEAGIVGPIDAI